MFYIKNGGTCLTLYTPKTTTTITLKQCNISPFQVLQFWHHSVLRCDRPGRYFMLWKALTIQKSKIPTGFADPSFFFSMVNASDRFPLLCWAANSYTFCSATAIDKIFTWMCVCCCSGTNSTQCWQDSWIFCTGHHLAFIGDMDHLVCSCHGNKG